MNILKPIEPAPHFNKSTNTLNKLFQVAGQTSSGTCFENKKQTWAIGESCIFLRLGEGWASPRRARSPFEASNVRSKSRFMSPSTASHWLVESSGKLANRQVLELTSTSRCSHQLWSSGCWGPMPKSFKLHTNRPSQVLPWAAVVHSTQLPPFPCFLQPDLGSG